MRASPAIGSSGDWALSKALTQDTLQSANVHVQELAARVHVRLQHH